MRRHEPDLKLEWNSLNGSGPAREAIAWDRCRIAAPWRAGMPYLEVSDLGPLGQFVDLVDLVEI